MIATLMFALGLLTGLLLSQGLHGTRAPMKPDEPMAGVVVGLMPPPWPARASERQTRA